MDSVSAAEAEDDVRRRARELLASIDRYLVEAHEQRVSSHPDAIVRQADWLMEEPGRTKVLAEILESSLSRPSPAPESQDLSLLLLTAACQPAGWMLLRAEFESELALAVDAASAEREEMGKGPCTLPILIAARDEEVVLPRTLKSMIPAIEELRAEFPHIRVYIVVCDNASADQTASCVVALMAPFERCGIPLHLVHEPNPGKVQAIRRLLQFVTDAGENAPAIAFSDADVEWTRETLTNLWTHLKDHSEIDVVGAAIVPRDGSLARGDVWGVLDCIAYLGLGGAEDQGLAKHTRIVTGMTYLGRTPDIVRHHRRTPVALNNEDTAISLLSGYDHLAVAQRAVVRYQACRSWREFWSIRFRHIRGRRELVRWRTAVHIYEAMRRRLVLEESRRLPGQWKQEMRAAEQEGRRKAEHSARRIIEQRTMAYARSVLLEKHTLPISRPDGRVELKRGRPIFLSPTYFVAIVFFMLPIYTLIKLAARFDARVCPYRHGWRPYRKGGGESGSELRSDPVDRALSPS